MKPMLAAPVDDLARLRYPVLASPKLDGIRCIVFGGVAMSRSLKPIPNRHVQKVLSQSTAYEGLDGELIVGDPTAKDVFQRTSSGVMTVEGTPDFQYHVFDKHYFQTGKVGEDGFKARLQVAMHITRGCKHMSSVPHTLLLNEAALLTYEAAQLAKGYEGVMLRDPTGPYKAGRATLKEGWLLKLKRFEDSEAEVIAYQLMCTNENPAVRNELGYMERSSKKEGMMTLPLIGALKVRDLKTGVEFDIGTGFTTGQRQDIYAGRHKLKGKLVKYKFQPTGVKDKPRFPVFIGFRDARDL